MQVAFGQIDESLVRNAARRVEPHQTHGATRVHAKHLATEEERLPTTATGPFLVLLEVARRRPRRAEPRQVARFHSSDF